MREHTSWPCVQSGKDAYPETFAKFPCTPYGIRTAAKLRITLWFTNFESRYMQLRLGIPTLDILTHLNTDVFLFLTMLMTLTGNYCLAISSRSSPTIGIDPSADTRPQRWFIAARPLASPSVHHSERPCHPVTGPRITWCWRNRIGRGRHCYGISHGRPH